MTSALKTIKDEAPTSDEVSPTAQSKIDSAPGSLIVDICRCCVVRSSTYNEHSSAD